MNADELNTLGAQLTELTRRVVVAAHDLQHARVEAAHLRAILSRIKTSLCETTALAEVQS